MRGSLIVLVTIVAGFLTSGVRGDGHLTRPTATNVSITRDGCGTTKLCLGDDGCDPAGNVLCTFVSTELVNGSSDVAFELFGNSTGYIAVVLASVLNEERGPMFVCSRDPGNPARNFLFRTATLSNGMVNITNTPNVDSITYNFNGSINGSFHQCTFITRMLTPSSSTRTSVNFQVLVVTGEVSADGVFQSPSPPVFRSSGFLDLANATALNANNSTNTNTTSTVNMTTTTMTTTTTTAMTTASGCPPLTHLLTQVFVVFLSALTLQLF